MARYARKGDGEPLLRVERPSSPSAQTTAHVISACFNDMLTRKPLDVKEINNMMVSRKEEREYHDRYVECLKEISDKYDQKIENLRALEQHLLQAKAKALAAEERAVATLAERFSSVEKTGLPQERCLLSQFLNEEHLAQYDLLIPSRYHPKIHLPQSPPKKTFPSYLQPTVSFNLHATIPLDTPQLTSANDKIQSRLKGKKQHGLQLGNSPLETLAKTHSAPSTKPSNIQFHNHTSSGQPNVSKSAACTDNSSMQKKCFSFVAEPSEIVFTSYQAGQTYELPLILRNVSTTSQQLSVTPPHTAHFSICIEHFPNAEGLIAPGMHCSYKVRFTPDSLADYTDHIKVMMHTGQSISVPLKGMRPVPDLSLPCVLDCGFCFTGDVKSITFECSNNGGEGNFHFHIPQSEHAVGNEVQSLALEIGPFTVTPSRFHLSPGDTTQVHLCFRPIQEGEHLEDVNLVYDNCHIQCIQLRGIAEHVEVGCLSVRLSTAHEITAFKNHKDEANFVQEGYSELKDIQVHPVITFDPTNPGQPVFKTATIKNFSNVDVQFQWKFYRPKIELPSPSDASSITCSSTIESKCSAFSVKPENGIFKAGEMKTFVFCFLSYKAGDYEDLANLFLLNIPDLCLKASMKEDALVLPSGQFSAVSVQLHGSSECYALQFVPPVINVLEGVSFGVEVRKQFKIVNLNCSTVSYCWNTYTDYCMGSISIDPPTGSIVPGSATHCEVVIVGMEEGLISTNMLCSVRYSDTPLPLQVEAYIQPAAVFIDIPSLNFGLIPLGNSGILQLPIRSETKATLQYEVRQKVSPLMDKDYLDCPCLSIATPRGELQPYGRASLIVECKPEMVGRLRSQLELFVGKKVVRCVEVRAEVQRPIVHLKSCFVYEGRAFVHSEVVKEVVLVNETLIPTQFTWSSQLVGESSNCCELHISPPAGRIGPRESLTLTLTAKWSAEGIHPEAVAICIVQGMKEPLFLHVSAEVFGISVCYAVNEGSPERQSLCLDFGSSNPLKSASTVLLKVTNTSAIKASLSLHVVHFPASKPPTPPAPKQTPGNSTARAKQLLHQTFNISDTTGRNKDQITSALLREGRGACFFIEPSSAELLPFESKTIAVTAHSDMWGEYKDELVSEVKGLAPVTIPIRYGVIGCPVVFQTTASSGNTTTRFGIHTPNSSPIRRVLKLKNPSPFDIRLNWEMFNNIDDDKLLDLIHFCGDPFPNQLIGQGDEKLQPSLGDTSTDLLPSFRVILKPHEGVRADNPFSIHPKQMVLPAHGQGVVEVTFHPSVAALDTLGRDITSYAMGYFSIDQQINSMAHRPTGYDVEPLRINITAGIARPILSLECDDEGGLHFTYPASIFIQDKQLIERIEKRHHFLLKNTGSTEIMFQIENESKMHFTFLTAPCTLKDNSINLKPNESIAVTMLFSLSLGDFKDKCRCDDGRVIFSERIVAIFSNGTSQVFELSIDMTVPTLTLSPMSIEFGTVFLGRGRELPIILSNNTLSDALWSLHIPSEIQHVLSVTPTSGMINAQQRSGNELIQLTFNPSSECTYECLAFLRNELTGMVHQIKVSGSGSADEKFSNMWQCT